MSTATTDVRPRDVLRCHRCLLVQFRTLSDLCRRCGHPLPPPPRLDIRPSGDLSPIRARSTGPVPFSANPNRHPEVSQPRGKTARELTIGRKLRELRERKHLTQQEMAGRAGVPRTYISRIENARLLPGPLMLHRIAIALEVAILDLLPGSNNNNGFADFGEDPFWTTLVGYFRQLQPEQMALVLSHVRAVVGENGEHDFAAHFCQNKS